MQSSVDVPAKTDHPPAGSGDEFDAAAISGAVKIDEETKRSIRILIVDDEHSLRESCASVLDVEGYDVSVCGRGSEAQDLLRRQAFDIVLLDLYMSQVPGLELLDACLESRPETIVIMITGNPSVETSIKALRAGAWDYLPKPFAAPQLQVLVGRAAHAVLVTRENRRREAELSADHGHSSKLTILGASPAFKRVIELARRVAATDASVFLSGESGTGKEMIAQFIHRHSRRAAKPLVAVNCAALPEPLLESEMFGHYEGAFTGAVRDKPGLLEAAHGGTMLLDELTEMAPGIQAKLLRVIQDGVVRRLGGTKSVTVVDVRFIAATNRPPQEATQDGSLRKD
ncbi:MAG: sigma-54-dependent transcriptional regulator, partial [Gemmatimonadota bacterium]